jgi:glutathione S-transferase
MDAAAAEATPVLHYFDCRSRGQALRFAFEDSEVEFEDRRVPVEDLGAFRARACEADLGGPFGALPILEWGEARIAQTLAIATYLSDRLHGPASVTATAERRALLAMVTSAALLDMQVPYRRLLWTPADRTDGALAGVARGLLDYLGTKLLQLDRVLEELAGPLFGGARRRLPTTSSSRS